MSNRVDSPLYLYDKYLYLSTCKTPNLVHSYLLWGGEGGGVSSISIKREGQNYPIFIHMAVKTPPLARPWKLLTYINSLLYFNNLSFLQILKGVTVILILLRLTSLTQEFRNRRMKVYLLFLQYIKCERGRSIHLIFPFSFLKFLDFKIFKSITKTYFEPLKLSPFLYPFNLT